MPTSVGYQPTDMKIEVDTEWCTQYHLTLEQALLLKAKLDPSNNLEEVFVLNNSKLQPYEIARVEDLYNKLKNAKPKLSDQWAQEFWDEFPKYCISPEGNKRYLRQGVLKRKAFSEYKKLIKTEGQHQAAIEYLRHDVAHRKETNSLMWINSIVKYIQNKPWESEELKGDVNGFIVGGDIE